MSRLSVDKFKNGRLFNGFDYKNQAWVIDGVYQSCGHPQMDCGCFGRIHAGQTVEEYQDNL